LCFRLKLNSGWNERFLCHLRVPRWNEAGEMEGESGAGWMHAKGKEKKISIQSKSISTRHVTSGRDCSSRSLSVSGSLLRGSGPGELGSRVARLERCNGEEQE
jgi:hypothetical protein